MIGANPLAGAVQDGTGGRTSRGAGRARRAAFLIGTSILVYAAVPSAALAQNECGPPPPGGGAPHSSCASAAEGTAA